MTLGAPDVLRARGAHHGLSPGKAALAMAQQTSTLSCAELHLRYRSAAGLTQEELAHRTGHSLRGIGDLERHAPSTEQGYGCLAGIF
jgi:hypothetical protein